MRQARGKFEAERRRLQEALKVNETIGAKLREMEPRLAQVQTDLFIRDPIMPSFEVAPRAQDPSLDPGLRSQSQFSQGIVPYATHFFLVQTPGSLALSPPL